MYAVIFHMSRVCLHQQMNKWPCGLVWSSLMLLASKRKDICASPQSLFHFHTIQFLVMEFHVMLSFFFFLAEVYKAAQCFEG